MITPPIPCAACQESQECGDTVLTVTLEDDDTYELYYECACGKYFHWEGLSNISIHAEQAKEGT